VEDDGIEGALVVADAAAGTFLFDDGGPNRFQSQLALLDPAQHARCGCGALLRPDIVWFGEMLPEPVLGAAWQAAQITDLFLVIGTSALVQPAASLPLLAKRTGARLIEINLEETPLSPDADQVLLELFCAAGDELSDYQDRVMNEAYLGTARKRVSVARHARLMDYHIHQGNQAGTWLRPCGLHTS